MLDLHILTSGQTVNTTLTPNTNARADATFDLNDSTYVTFYYHDMVPLWTALLSVANQQVVLIEPVISNGVTLVKGLKVTFNPMGKTYTVLLYGQIIDSKTRYEFTGLPLGVFTRDEKMKSAIRSLARR